MDGWFTFPFQGGWTYWRSSGSSEPKGRMQIELLREWLWDEASGWQCPVSATLKGPGSEDPLSTWPQGCDLCFQLRQRPGEGVAVSSWTSSCSTERPARVLPDKVLTQTTLRVKGVEKKKGHRSNHISTSIPEKSTYRYFFSEKQRLIWSDGTVVKAVKRRETGPVFPKVILIWNKSSPQNASEVWHSCLALGLWCLGSVAERCVVLCCCWYHLLKGTSLPRYYKANMYCSACRVNREGEAGFV